MTSPKMSEERLLACPFCGGEGRLKRYHIHAVVVRCADCEAEGPDVTATDAEAISAWNRRHTIPYAGVSVPWPGRTFCETAGRNATELAKWVKGKDDRQVASDAAQAITTLLSAIDAVPHTPENGGDEPVGWIKPDRPASIEQLREKVAEAIRSDGSDLCDTPWATLPADRKIGWLGDADRALAVVKEYLIPDAARVSLPPQPSPHVPEVTEARFAELVDKEWNCLCEKDDRSSPVEYPDMALVTRNELAAMMRAALNIHDAGDRG